MRSMYRTLLFNAVALAAIALPAHAQPGPISSGVFAAGRDLNWDIAVGAGAAVDAFQVTNNPGWNDFAGPTAARWISFSASASNPAATPYHFTTTFSLAGYDPTSASLGYQCGVDNTLNAVRLNGVVVLGASCVFHALSATQSISSGFVAGINTLEFEVNGDQVTDGFIFNNTSFSARQIGTTVAPEPSTILLLATGLGVLGVTARRRKTRS